MNCRCTCISQYSRIEDSMEVHTPNVNKEEPWKSKFTAITTHKLYLFKVFIVLFIKTPYLYLYGLDFHYCRKYTSCQLFMGITRFLSICSVSSLQFHFVLLWLFFFPFFLWQQSSTFYLCKCNFYEKVFLYEENQKFCNDFYQHETHHEECHPWQRGGTPGW